MEAKRVSLADIARVVGCSTGTVSLALNHDERIRPSTREAVARAAKELGYVPNLVLAALARKRFKPMPVEAATLVAFITEDGDWAHTEDLMARDIMAMAHPHGLEITRYPLQSLRQMKRADRVLYHRGTEGIILSPLVKIGELGDFDWSLFSVVGMSTDLDADSAALNSFIHRASPDHFWSGQRCWLEAKKAGYRRIGTVLRKHSRVIADDAHRIASALLSTHLTGPRNRIPLLTIENPDSPDEVRRWVKKHKPEVVLGQDVHIAHLLGAAGWQIPDDVAYINLHFDGSGKYACVNLGEGFEAGLDFISSLIRKRQRGLPSVSQTVLVHPIWIPGPSLPPKVTHPKLTD